eukprot:CAMPEP_0194578026 /NCGR_PEP_ID=MMETSP0292-20121207/12589_1 /TAXON_ID=39354 /ORGANISM="Heterosigma akashiwo, Strain CCMP2393" /LENGTH=214 /DNA_ID=CAMNT_0039430559 /DNA_START=101 /DNA_END=745 /DNA_ORIENTATION=+
MSDADDIFIIRHGERIDYIDRNWLSQSGHTRADDPHLAPKGHTQAREVSERMDQYQIEHIFASPFIRCVETAAAIAERRGLQINIEPGICEVLSTFPPGFMETEDLAQRFAAVNTSYEPVMPRSELSSEWGDGDCITRASAVATQIRERVTGPILFVGHGASCAGIGKAFSGRTSYQGLTTLSYLTRASNSSRYQFILNGCAEHLSDKSNLRAY